MRNTRVGLLTGPIGVGKTTVAERVAGLARKQGIQCGGLLAPPLMDQCGQKVGIWGVDLLTGERHILAHVDRHLGGPTVGRYSFSQSALDWGLGVIETAMRPSDRLAGRVCGCDLIIVDEIGKLELWHGIGLARILPRLVAAGAPPSLVLVRESLLCELQRRLESVAPIVFSVRKDNRGALAPRILRSLVTRHAESTDSSTYERKKEAQDGESSSRRRGSGF